ncbi:MAG: hypothetical protein NEHIOOID_00513 [Holosporales bacterium]
MGMLSGVEASSPKKRPEPLDLLSVQERAYERAEEESMKKIIKIEDKIQKFYSPKVTQHFKKCCGLLSLKIPSQQDKEKVWNLIKDVYHTNFTSIINSNKILIERIPNPTVLDRLNIIEGLATAPLSSHLPYPKFVELCLSLETPTHSFSSLVLALSNVEPRYWTILYNYAETFGEHKAHVAAVLSHLLFDQWERATVILSERISLFETMPLRAIVEILKNDDKTR